MCLRRNWFRSVADCIGVGRYPVAAFFSQRLRPVFLTWRQNAEWLQPFSGLKSLGNRSCRVPEIQQFPKADELGNCKKKWPILILRQVTEA